MMKTGFLIGVALVFGWAAPAQIPRTLQLAVTNGTATVSSQTTPGFFFGQLETATNLTAGWSGVGPFGFQTGVSNAVSVVEGQQFFRLRQVWPVFEFAIFYNLNLELDPGSSLTINGPVWSNAGIWAGTSRLTFNSTVAAVGQVSTSTVNPFAPGKTDGSAPPVFTLAGQPTSGQAPLTLPVPDGFNDNATNLAALFNVPPTAYATGTDAAYTTNGLLYFANRCDLIISNSFKGTNYGSLTPYGTNLSLWFQNPYHPASYLTPLTPDFYIFKKAAATGFTTNFVSYSVQDTNRCYTNVYYAGWSFLTNVAFYDYRESDTVQAVQIDVARFNQWLTNPAVNGGYNYNQTCLASRGHTINSIWINNSVPLTSATLPAVRLINGSQLANAYGLTVVTPLPIYVIGDYNKQIDASHVSSGTNTLYTYPAALMGDALTILSDNWSDTYTAFTGLAPRVGAATTVNAACLVGMVPSVSPNFYSGGMENFFRFQENWNGITVTFNGSMVAMFPSAYATNRWGLSNVYSVPARNWGFDFNFSDPAKLPPLTPVVGTFGP